jgi:hypothetical protein
MQGSGKDLIQPVLDNQLKTISPLVVPEGVRALASLPIACVPKHPLFVTVSDALRLEAGLLLRICYTVLWLASVRELSVGFRRHGCNVLLQLHL